MNVSHNLPSAQALTILSALQSAVTKTLETKRRLGHYAVFWKNGDIIEKHFTKFGIMEGEFIVPDNFDNPLPKDIEDEFYSANL